MIKLYQLFLACSASIAPVVMLNDYNEYEIKTQHQNKLLGNSKQETMQLKTALETNNHD